MRQEKHAIAAVATAAAATSTASGENWQTID